MTDKEKIREEVERLFKENRERSSIEGYAAVEQLRKVLAFIDSLEVKEIDLKKEIEAVKHNYKVDNNRHTTICSADIEWIAEHFYELGLKAQKGE